MEHRNALTISFTLDKDNSMGGNSLKIPKTHHRSSECGKAQIHWTKITEYHGRYQHMNGSTLLDGNHPAMVKLGRANSKPRVILTDVLKTKLGRAYVDVKRRSLASSSVRQTTGLQRDSFQEREESQRCRISPQREAAGKEAAHRNQSVRPRNNHKTTVLPPRRTTLRSSLAEDNDPNVKEVVIGKGKKENCKLQKVIDAKHPVQCEKASGPGHVECRGGEEVSSESSDDTGTDLNPESEVQESHGTKRESDALVCGGNGTCKCRKGDSTSSRGSVLRHPGQGREDGEPARKRLICEASGEHLGSGRPDRLVVQINVGGAVGTERGLSPVAGPTSEAGGALEHTLPSNQDNAVKASSSEPIVLSSDDEDSRETAAHCSPVIHSLLSAGEPDSQQAPSQQDGATQEDIPDKVVHVTVEDFPVASPSDFKVPFTSLHCGGYHGDADGSLLIGHQKVIIPLKGASGQVKVVLCLTSPELRKYSVWQFEELQAQELGYEGEEQPPPSTLLLFWVSDTWARAAERELRKLSLTQHVTKPTDKASPFLLVSLRDTLQGVEGAVLRSHLDIICLNCVTQEDSEAPGYDGLTSEFADFILPGLSLESSLELIRGTGRDPYLLSLLGEHGTNPESVTDHSSLDSDEEEEPEPHLDVRLQREPTLKPQAMPESDPGPQHVPGEERTELAKEASTEERGRKPTYTLCHRRTRGSYAVTLSKPDSSWTKYKHQGLARRLIQFPPPPLKGGISVTMEDMQCLDSGQYLNDVIIDFFLKYLLQNAPAATVERVHIFSSFFYKQLTRRDNASEDPASASNQRQRRHQRVKTWTRHVDIFKKDFLFVPVNQEAHWYLVVICFPGLEEAHFEERLNSATGDKPGDLPSEEAHGSNESNGGVGTSPVASPAPSLDRLDGISENAQAHSTEESPPGPPTCTEQTCHKRIVCKRPCILIMDSLKVSFHERVFKLLREYLQSEWEVRRGTSRDFNAEQMKSSYCQVPLQDNSSDCGLYLLQYVESFLKDPVVHFELPLCLQRWFPRQQVRRKRDEIRDLILHLYRQQAQNNVGR